MPVQAHGLAMAVTEVKHRRGTVEVQRRVAAVHRAVVVGAEEDEVAKSVVAASACPTAAVELTMEMLAARQVRECPRADHPAFALRPGARTDALLAGHRAIAGMFYGDRPRRSIQECNEVIRTWLDAQLCP